MDEPIYGKVSNQVLKDFHRSSIGTLEGKFRLSAEVLEQFNRSPEMQQAFRRRTAPGPVLDAKRDSNPAQIPVRPQLSSEAIHMAAILIQKRLRGLAVRKKRGGRSYLAFAKLLVRADAASRAAVVKNLVVCIRLAHQAVKAKRQALLNGYITYCALRVQKTFRGYYARKYTVRFWRGLRGARGYRKLEGVVLAWRTRRVLALRDARSKAQLIRDHDSANLGEDVGARELAESRKTAVKKLLSFIEAMEKNGQWTMLHQGAAAGKERASKGYKVPQSKDEEDAILAKLGKPSSSPGQLRRDNRRGN